MSGQEREAIVVNVDPTPVDLFRVRCVTYLFTARRAELLTRLAVVVVANVFFLFRLAVSSDGCTPWARPQPGPWVGMLMLSTVFWFAWPFLRGLRLTTKEARRLATKVTIHDEGFVAEGLWGTTAAAWSVVRSVRRQRSGVVIVLDAACIDVPRIPEPTSEAILGIFRQSRSPVTSSAKPEERGPYRAAAPMILAEDAAPEEWEPAAGYPHRALAFTSRADMLRALLRANPKAALGTMVSIVVPVLPAWLVVAEPAVERPFTTLALFFGLFTLATVGHVHARAFVLFRDRAITERSRGVLYAVGGAGLYVRSHSFEHRIPWERVRVGKRTRRAIIVATEDAVHTIPRAAFHREEERAAFERVVQFELDARKPPEPAPE